MLDRVLTEVRAGRVGFDVVRTNAAAMKLMRRHESLTRYLSHSYEAFLRASHDPDGVLSPISLDAHPHPVQHPSGTSPGAAPQRDGTDGAPVAGRGAARGPHGERDPCQLAVGPARQLGEGWRVFVERLAANAALVESVLEVVQRVVSGEYPVGVSFIKHVHSFRKEGAPLDYARLDPVLALPRHVGMSARAAHPAAPRLFVDALLSRTAPLALAQAGERVLVPGVCPPSGTRTSSGW
ncbi:MAG: hypothetical protein C4304_09090 [candidate division GAL15 bacterium]